MQLRPWHAYVLAALSAAGIAGTAVGIVHAANGDDRRSLAAVSPPTRTVTEYVTATVSIVLAVLAFAILTRKNSISQDSAGLDQEPVSAV